MADCVNLPIGFKFRPRDNELLEYYLLNKVRGAPIMYEKIVPEIDLYGETEPWQIWDHYGGHKLEKGECLYFFTKLKSVNGGKGSRMARTVGSGTWKEDSGTEVKNRNGVVIGFSRRYSYQNPRISGQCGGWNMQEFRLKPSLLPNSNSSRAACCNHGEYVICRIKKNERKRNWACCNDDDNALQSPNKKIDSKLDMPIAQSQPQPPQPQPISFVPNYPITETYEQQKDQTIATGPVLTTVTDWETGHQQIGETVTTNMGLNQSQYYYGNATQGQSSNGNYISYQSEIDPAMASSVASLQYEHLQQPIDNNLGQFNEVMVTSNWTSDIPVDQPLYGVTNGPIDQQSEQIFTTVYDSPNNVTNGPSYQQIFITNYGSLNNVANGPSYQQNEHMSTTNYADLNSVANVPTDQKNKQTFTTNAGLNNVTNWARDQQNEQTFTTNDFSLNNVANDPTDELMNEQTFTTNASLNNVPTDEQNEQAFSTNYDVENNVPTDELNEQMFGLNNVTNCETDEPQNYLSTTEYPTSSDNNGNRMSESQPENSVAHPDSDDWQQYLVFDDDLWKL